MAGKIELYRQPTPVFDKFNVDSQLNDVMRREVKLPGGGYICVDETEALIAIDVNTGKGKRQGTDQPELILQTNLEAADEIARQLRLRNIGGLVVLDFIDMRSSRDRDEVYRHMKKLAKQDRAKTKVLPISRLGLMEMTRQREHESLLDTVFTGCPYCGGTGLVKSAMSMSVEIQRELQQLLHQKKWRGRALRVVMHPDVLERLRNEDASLLEEMERLEREGATFLNKQVGDARRIRYVAPSVVAVLTVLLMGGLIGLMLWAFAIDASDAPPLPLIVVLVMLPGVVILGVLLALYQRIREIQKGEADDAKHY